MIPVVLEESGSLLASAVAVENRSIHGRQFHHHQRIQRIAKVRIDVESKQPGVQLQILPMALIVRYLIKFEGDITVFIKLSLHRHHHHHHHESS